MDQEFLRELQGFYARLETRSGQLFHALLHEGFELETGWYSGHYHKSDHETWVRESWPIPVIGVKGFCDIEVQSDQISVSTKRKRSAALHDTYEKFAGYAFEAYGTEDYLADFYHSGQTIEELKENIRACREREIGFSFVFSFDIEDRQICEFVALLRREGFYD